MAGAPSQIDTWDYKPALWRRDGQELAGFDQSTGFFAGLGGPIMKPPFRFRQYGESGKWASDLFPYLSGHVDQMAFIHSCYAHENNHSPAQFEMLVEGNTCDPSAFFADFGVSSPAFDAEALGYLRQY